MSEFHDISLPIELALGASGGTTWKTEVQTLASGREVRNARWSQSRRRWDVGSAAKSLADIEVLTTFFEARRGRFSAFRFRDQTDWKSCSLAHDVSAMDQVIGVGDGDTQNFQLMKAYASGGAQTLREITKPVVGSVILAVDGVEQHTGWQCDYMSGQVSFAIAPPEAAVITAGFTFDIPVRFDTDSLTVSLDHLNAGRIVSAPIIEVFM